MGLEVPRYDHHVEDITEYTDGLHAEKLNVLLIKKCVCKVNNFFT